MVEGSWFEIFMDTWMTGELAGLNGRRKRWDSKANIFRYMGGLPGITSTSLPMNLVRK